MTKVLSLSEAGQELAACVRDVEQGSEVVITRDGKPVARLVPVLGHRELTEEQKAAFERMCEQMRVGYPIGAGKLDRDSLHER